MLILLYIISKFRNLAIFVIIYMETVFDTELFDVFFYASSSQLFVTVYMETAFDKKII